MSFWMLDKDSYESYVDIVEKSSLPSAEELANYEATFEATDGVPRIMNITGTQANIRVTGILTGAPDFFAQFFGGGNTTYGEIIAAAQLADKNPDVKKVEMFVDSPGGEASAAWLAAMDAVKAISKPVHVTVGNMAASAAFGIASQADKIFAQNKLSKVGSVGVVTTIRKDDSVIQITSKNAPKKRPDVNTKEGKEAVLETVNAIEDIFIGAVAEGRDTTPEKVIADFGKGGVVFAEDAISRNMIDGIVGSTENSSSSTAAQAGNKPKEIMKMNLTELLAKHPALHAEVLATGVTQGVDSERARVNAHLKLGKSSGAMDVATKAIEDGTVCDANVQADYMAVLMADMKAGKFKAEDTETEEAIDGATDGTKEIKKKGAKASEDDGAKAAADLMDEEFGIDPEGDAE